MGLLGSDDSEDPERGGFNPAYKLKGGYARRVIDEEAGVVIWAVKTKEGYGLTSLPIEQTDLSIDGE